MPKIIDRSGKGAAIDAAENDTNLEALHGVNQAVAGATHTVDISDQGDTLEFTNGGAVAVTLDAIATILAASHTADFKITLVAVGTGTIVTITPNAADSFNTGESTIVLNENEVVTIQTDSTGLIWNVINVKPKGWQLLTVKEASASATIDFTTADGIGSKYDYYKVEFYNVYCDSSGLLRARASIASVFQTTVSYSSISTTAAGITGTSWRINAVVTDSGSTGGGVTHGTLQLTLGDAGTDHETVIMGQIATASNAGSTKSLSESITLTYVFSGAVTAIDGLRFFASTGNIAQGTFMLYGMQK